MSAIRQFLKRVKTFGVRRRSSVHTVSMGRERVFEAWDCGNDTYIFERGVSARLSDRPSMLVAAKSALRSADPGHVLTLSSGNHSVAALPLLDGRMWGISQLPSQVRSEALSHDIICANVVGDTIEISQRDVPTQTLVAADGWLLGTAGFAVNDVVMADRNEATLEHYRRLGYEWRVKPLAWTEAEMKVALAASQKRIASSLVYYHSARGVHFITFTRFREFAELAETNITEFVKALQELVSVYEGNDCSFTRMPKHRGHHEIEFFGVRRGAAVNGLIPALEDLMKTISVGRIGQLGVIQRIHEIVALYESMLTQTEFADDTSKRCIETLYMYITGEIYAVVGDGTSPAFDDRRTALPGATFVDGRPIMDAGSDERTEILMTNLRRLMSKDELVVYANVYELRAEDDEAPIGKGLTREIVFKTNRRPLETSMVEKRLSRSATGYGSYVLARVEALKALGVTLSADYRILQRHRPRGGRSPYDFYVRGRCEGDPIDAIPHNYYCSSADAAAEEKEVVLALAGLMGDAAAQNLAMKKFEPKCESPLFGVGKEIYEFEYDIVRERVMPKRVATCSVRGSFGWPDLSETDANLDAIGSFYLGHYAHALKAFARRHTVPAADLAERFLSGFSFRIKSMAWQLSVMREEFEDFVPELPRKFRFTPKWRFVLWSLDRHAHGVDALRSQFLKKMEVVENEDIRNNSEPVRFEPFPG